MKIIFADDMADMRKNIADSLESLEKKHGPFTILGQASDGKELIDLVERHPDVDLVFTDLRMPNMDGLSALVYLIANKKCRNVFMISSENIISLNQAQKGRVNIELEEKIVLLDKIAHRVIDNDYVAGKINSILLGCEKLNLDPIAIAEYYGAAGYMRKPISTRKMNTLFESLNHEKTFINISAI